ncbi:MAG: cytochrome c oxidase subunit 3 [Bacteroidetes bacterium]|nr:cytochrome c oxidase subunit 3 [Bacteroidota bacterium]
MDYSNQVSPEVKEKMKKNLVFVGIFAIVMFFAGLTSAYYVSMGGGFWLKYPMPSGFYLSTAVILLSSITFILAIQQVKKGAIGAMKILMVLTFMLGVLFVVFQFKGYRQLINAGVYNPSMYWSYPEILVNDGRYGDTLLVYKDQQPITVDGNDFYWNNKKLTDREFKDFQRFMKNYAIPEQVIFAQQQKPIKAYPSDQYTLYYNNLPLIIKNEMLYKNDSTPLTHVDEIRLCKVALNVTLGRGHFMIKGTIGKDFDVYLKGNKLDYKDGGFWSKGQRLSETAQLRAKETSDNSSAFLYVITFAHLLHIIGALIYLMFTLKNALSNRYTKENTLSLRMAGMFWHFLGVLWLYLFLFFNFIH